MNYRRMLRGTAALLAVASVCAANTVLCFAEEEESEEEQEVLTYECGDYVYSRLVNTEDESLTAVSIEAYSGSEENLVIPSQLDGLDVVKLGDTAFADADFLNSVTIPKTVSNLGTYTFADCNNLHAYHVESGNEFFMEQDGVLYSADGLTLMRYPVAECPAEPELQDGLESIGNVAFSGCTTLKTLNLPNSIEYLGVSAFSDCTALENVTLSTSLQSIEAFVFNGCSALKSIVFPDSVTWIGDAAFASTGLESVNLTSYITQIGQQAFANTPMKEVTIPPTVQEIGYSAFGWSLNHDGKLCMDEEFVIHGQVGSAASDYATDSFAENKFQFVDDYTAPAAEEAESETEAPAETTAPAAEEPETKSNTGKIIGIAAVCVLAAAVIGIILKSGRGKEDEEKTAAEALDGITDHTEESENNEETDDKQEEQNDE